MSSSPQNNDLRTMSLLASPTKDHHRPGRRTSQHLRSTDTRLGSPTSIPSSPTSIQSSSSAIFERDIEPILPPSPPNHTHRPLDPHRIPRARTTEQLDQAVPSVLDSAAAILTNIQEDSSELVSVVAPSSSVFDGLSASGFASPLSLRSRSPSPLGARNATGRAESLLLLNLPIPSAVQGPPVSATTTTAPGPLARSLSATPSVITISSGNEPDPELTIPSSLSSSFSSPSSPSSRSPRIKSDTLSPTASAFAHPSPLSSPMALSSTTSHPPSPTHVATKRLSFMSYSDLLSSTPASTHTLTSLTTSASSSEPPPHIPSVSGLNLVSATTASVNASRAGSIRGFSLVPSGGLSHAGKRDSIAMLDNVGGEWEREGMGRGLEERLEGAAAVGMGSVGASPVVGTSALPVFVGGRA